MTIRSLAVPRWMVKVASVTIIDGQISNLSSDENQTMDS